MLITQASGAQVESLWLTVNDDSNWVNVWYPAAISTAFRVAYIMTELD